MLSLLLSHHLAAFKGCVALEKESSPKHQHGCFWSDQVLSGPDKLNHGPAPGWGLLTYSILSPEHAMAPS